MHGRSNHGIGWMGLAMLLAIAAAAPAQAARTDLVLQGKIVDDSGGGLGGVQVKAFVDGFLRGQSISGADGTYTLSFAYDDLGDQTIVVWWLPAMGGQVPELAILRESRRAKQLGLWSPCIPRVPAQPSLTFDVTVHQEAEKFKLLGEDECMKALRDAK